MAKTLEQEGHKPAIIQLAALIVIAAKNDGTSRFFVDYKRLNKFT